MLSPLERSLELLLTTGGARPATAITSHGYTNAKMSSSW
jgi:hypothetical protein